MKKESQFLEGEAWGKRRLLKNFLAVCFSVFFNFAAYGALESLQSSINCDAGLGVVCLSILYATFILSSMFAPALTIRYLGLKWTIACSMCGYAAYTTANYYPSWATLIPASALVGLVAGPLWTANSTYLTTASIRYAKITGETKEAVISRFSGIFFMFFRLSRLIGNGISSPVLSQDSSDQTKRFTCGAQECYIETGGENATTYCDPPGQNLRNILVSIYLGLGVVAIFIAVIFVERMQTINNVQEKNTWSLFSATARLMRDQRQIHLIPLTVFIGLQLGFLGGDFTKSYVTCTLGVGWVGYAMVCFGLINALFSLLWGVAAKYIGRVSVLLTVASVYAFLFIFLLIWVPTPDKMWVFFLTVAVWGIADAGLELQTIALIGCLFHDRQEAAFSNYYLWTSVGFAVSFAYSNFLCVWIKIVILICTLILAMYGYVTLEYNVRKTPRL